jgi:hypothetical protein
MLALQFLAGKFFLLQLSSILRQKKEQEAHE